MSRPDRPYRFTVVYPNATSHWDYATKEDRAAATLGVDGECTTVTSRKPLKPGTPVCWVNVYAEGHPASHRTKAFADSAASTATLSRLHCIPVYLPGEGAAKAEGEVECRNQMRAQHAQEIKDWRHTALILADAHHRTAEAKQWEVEWFTNLAQGWETTARERAEERDAAKAEVEQWKDAAEHAEGKLSEERMSSQAERKECDKLQAEVERLTKELAEARVTWGSAEIASLRKLYAAAMEVRSWFDPPKHVQNALIRAVHDHAEKFGKPTEQP